MEIWDLYDENRNKLGVDHIRGELIPEGAYHLAVHVWIKNKNNQYLLGKRAAYKKRFALLWDCVAGSVLKDEESLEGAMRETIEEVGIDLTNVPGKVIRTMIRKDKKDIVDVYEFYYDGDVSLSNAKTKEVEELMWASKEEILDMFEKGTIVPNLSYFIEVFNA